MNNSFLKLVSFELKVNALSWTILLTSSIAALILIYLKLHSETSTFLVGGSSLPLFILLSCLFTLHAYSESTTKQTMELYHLLPVSRNLKFITKQLFTFIFFPVILLTVYFIFVFLIDPIFSGKVDHSLLSPNLHPIKIFSMFLYGHSITTVIAIVVKKHKVLYALAIYFGFTFGVGVLVAIIMNTLGPLSQSRIQKIIDTISGIPEILHFTIPIILYMISYRLFFRRQL